MRLTPVRSCPVRILTKHQLQNLDSRHQQTSASRLNLCTQGLLTTDRVPQWGRVKMFREKIDFPLENKKRYYDGSNGKNDHHA